MYKKFFIGVVSVTLCILLIIGSVVFIVDPFNHYRADEDLTKIIYQMPYYQNVGIAKHAEYDTLITGTSMTQNFRADQFDEKLGCQAVRLSFDGGIISDFCALLKTAFESNNNLNRVYFGLDNYLITEDSNLNNETARIPEYLIDNNPLTDVKYLLNKDVIFEYMRTYFSYRFYKSYDFYEMHAWDNGNVVFSKQSVLDIYETPVTNAELNIKSYYSQADKLSGKLCAFINENSQTKFVFFAPPYSILYWHTLLNEGKLNATISAMKTVYGSLLEYDNVRIFFFQNNAELITNLDNYKDPIHYKTAYNEYMLDCFVSGEHEITKENYVDVLNNMKEFALNYDYESIFA